MHFPPIFHTTIPETTHKNKRIKYRMRVQDTVLAYQQGPRLTKESSVWSCGYTIWCLTLIECRRPFSSISFLPASATASSLDLSQTLNISRFGPETFTCISAVNLQNIDLPARELSAATWRGSASRSEDDLHLSSAHFLLHDYFKTSHNNIPKISHTHSSILACTQSISIPSIQVL